MDDEAGIVNPLNRGRTLAGSTQGRRLAFTSWAMPMTNSKIPETRDAQLTRLNTAIKKTETQIKEILAKRGVGGMYLAETEEEAKIK